jgi:ATP-dependent 26S proteasome regulatory subunit
MATTAPVLPVVKKDKDKDKEKEQTMPVFLQKIMDDYKSKIAHVFIVHGNIDDFSDNSGHRYGILPTMRISFDSKFRESYDPKTGEEKETRGLDDSKEHEAVRGTQKIMAYFSLSQGLEFVHPKSREAWEEFLTSHYKEQVKEWRDDWKNPSSLEAVIWVLNKWFKAIKEVVMSNRVARKQGSGTRKEVMLNIVFLDADALFPHGDIAQLQSDRFPIVNIRAWAREEQIGDRNRIILLSRHLSDVHESIRSGVGIATHAVAKPSLEDREEWLNNFDTNLRRRTQQKVLEIGNHTVTKVNLAGENETEEKNKFTFHDFAVQAAGMSRRQMEDVIMHSWLNNIPVDFQLVRERKQRAMQDEYEGVIDFYEPEFGFEQIGGHEHLKRYFERKIIHPLRQGDRRRASKGVLMTGPPGTGKTVIAKALAKEAKMNFMIGRLDKLFGGVVGETEKKTAKFLEAVEAASPVILFLDELDSVLSGGRSSPGDSGVSGRVFNSIMTFLSDESRAGRVVVVSASNRPDLLDTALIRSGRFDAKLPALPPQKGDAEGRKKILAALLTKHQVKFNKEMQETMKDPTNGLGLLLMDKERVWTGAEMEVVLKEALDNALYAGHSSIKVEEWNEAFHNIIPNTGEVEKMTNLALIYVDHLGYCPPEWREIAADKKKLKDSLKQMGWEEED